MALLALLLAGLSLACCVVLVLRLRALDRATRDLPLPEVALLTPSSRPSITIEVLNPIELAAAQSRAGALLGSVRPQMVTKLVYDQVAKKLLEGLEEEGVVAEVRIHAAE